MTRLIDGILDNDYRLGIAQKMGATRAVNVTRETLDDVMRELA